MVVVISGNPFDGMTVHGPFSEANEANEWASANNALRDESWWVVPMESP